MALIGRMPTRAITLTTILTTTRRAMGTAGPSPGTATELAKTTPTSLTARPNNDTDRHQSAAGRIGRGTDIPPGVRAGGVAGGLDFYGANPEAPSPWRLLR